MPIPKDLKNGIKEFTKQRYNELKKQYGPIEVAKYFSNILNEIKNKFSSHVHFKNLEHPDQSWRKILGDALEVLFQLNIGEGIQKLGLLCAKPTRECLGERYDIILDKISVEIGKNKVQPDSDLVVYLLEPLEVIAILSVKKKFRERIAQVAYWTIKLRGKEYNIKNFLITTDEDKTFSLEKKIKQKVKIREDTKQEIQKAKAIAETDTNGTFVAAEFNIDETEKIKTYEKIFEELKRLKNGVK